MNLWLIFKKKKELVSNSIQFFFQRKQFVQILVSSKCLDLELFLVLERLPQLLLAVVRIKISYREDVQLSTGPPAVRTNKHNS